MVLNILGGLEPRREDEAVRGEIGWWKENKECSPDGFEALRGVAGWRKEKELSSRAGFVAFRGVTVWRKERGLCSLAECVAGRVSRMLGGVGT